MPSASKSCSGRTWGLGSTTAPWAPSSGALRSAGGGPRRALCHQSLRKLLQPLFIVQTFHTGESIIGQTATVASLSVTASHGQARILPATKNADITLQIVSDEEGLAENDLVSIVGYDNERNVYDVRLLEKHRDSQAALGLESAPETPSPLAPRLTEPEKGPFMTPLIVAAVVVFLVIVAILLGFLMVYRKVEQGDALIINKVRGEPNVTFTGGIVVPILHMAEFMDISVKTITVDRRGTDGLICQDNIRADITVAFYVRVNKSAEDVLKVASAVGVKRASDMATLEQLFQAKFSEALKTVGKQMDFVELYNERKSFKDRIIATIGTDFNGYLLEDTAIDYLEQTPLEHLDADNILDSEGIRKITNLTEEQRKKTNLIKREAEKTIKKQDVEAKEAILALEKQQV